MADIVSKAVRSRMMSGIRGKDTKPEVQVRRFLHSRGLRFRLHDRTLPGRPDIVLPRWRTVVLVHGCFWHQHKGCRFAYMPASNASFWREKLGGNVKRDRRNVLALRALGWRVLHFWECETKSEHKLAQLEGRIRKGGK
jgi:DNA mismatch endonuclease (patch repair protein)